MNNKKGFSLMELLIVVIIIAGFAAMTYPSYLDSIERARASEAVQMLGVIQAAQQKHYVQYEEYATKFSDINDFVPAIENFDSNQNNFNTEYFYYELKDGDLATADRTPGKGYTFQANYTDDFIRCIFNNDEGEKVCSSLTDKEKKDGYYPIY